MNRKNKTVKQLQAECRKRKIGFMMNWTKIALTKRLEDEDKRDASKLKLEESTAKNIKDKQDKLNEQQVQMEQYTKALGKLDKKALEQKAIDSLINQKQTMLSKLQDEFGILQEEQNQLLKRNSIIAHRKSELHAEMESIDLLIKSLI